MALTRVRGTPIQLHTSFQRGAGLNQDDESFSRDPKGLNREKEREKVAIGSPELQGSGSSSPTLNAGLEGVLQSHSSPLI